MIMDWREAKAAMLRIGFVVMVLAIVIVGLMLSQ